MITLALFSNLMSVMLREWVRCRRLTHRAIAIVLVILPATVLVLTCGNYLRDLLTKGTAS
jgi:hypothetical protein